MKTNMGVVDKTIRILVAVAIGMLYFRHLIPGTWTIFLLAGAAIFFVTGFTGFCPLYAIFGMRTKRQAK